MTISSQTFRWRYTSTGGTTYPYTNKILDQDDLVVYVDDVLQTIGTHYSVTGVESASGGNVVFVSAPTSGSDVLITKDGVEFTQDTDYVENDDFPAASHENALDKLTNIAQKIWDYTRRSVKLSITSTLTDLEMPDPVADKLIGWNATGTALANLSFTTTALLTGDAGSSLLKQDTVAGIWNFIEITDTGSSLITAESASTALTKLGFSTYMKTLVDDTSSAAARTTLGFETKRQWDIVQIKYNQTAALSSISSGTVADDDSPPLITEGAEYISQKITPTDASNLLEVEALFNCSQTSGGGRMTTIFICKDNVSTSIAAGWRYLTSGISDQIKLHFFMTAGQTTEMNLRLFAGMDSSGTLDMNGRGAGRMRGGTLYSSLKITEYQA